MVTPAHASPTYGVDDFSVCDKVMDWVTTGLKVSGYAVSVISLFALPVPLNILTAGIFFAVTKGLTSCTSPMRYFPSPHATPQRSWSWMPSFIPLSSGNDRVPVGGGGRSPVGGGHDARVPVGGGGRAPVGGGHDARVPVGGGGRAPVGGGHDARVPVGGGGRAPVGGGHDARVPVGSGGLDQRVPVGTTHNGWW